MSRKYSEPPKTSRTESSRTKWDFASIIASLPEITRRLHLVSKTIHNHSPEIFLKLRVADLAEALILAREDGM